MRLHSAEKIPVIKDTDVQICFVSTDHVTDPALLEAYRALLSPQERARLARFVFDKDRHLFLMGRALLRTMLSHYADIAPEDWAFVTDAYGKPEIQLGIGGARFRFNLSHSGGLCLCAVTRTRDIGIDVERVETTLDRDLAKRVLSAAELSDLARHASAGQAAVFFQYWTLKEAYVKARGEGLSIDLQSIRFDLRANAPVRASFLAPNDDDPRAWQFKRLEISKDHKAALAIRLEEAAALHVDMHEVIPLTGHRVPCPGVLA